MHSADFIFNELNNKQCCIYCFDLKVTKHLCYRNIKQRLHHKHQNPRQYEKVCFLHDQAEDLARDFRDGVTSKTGVQAIRPRRSPSMSIQNSILILLTVVFLPHITFCISWRALKSGKVKHA